MRRLVGVAGVLLVGGSVLAAPAARADEVAAVAVSSPAVQVTTVRDPRISESSGLVVSPTRPDVVWTVNDSGSGPVVFAVSLRTGRTAAVLTMVGPSGRPLDVVDTEALAAVRGSDGATSLVVGDIGDNRRTRDEVTLLRLAEPSDVRSQQVETARLPLRYPDGATDAESLVATSDGRLLVVTKTPLWGDVYEVPRDAVRRLLSGRSTSRAVVLTRVGRLPVSLATDASGLPDGRVVVRDYGSATLYGWQGDELVAQASVTLPKQQQGETIAVEPGGRTALVGSEGIAQPLWRVGLDGAPSSTPSSTPSPKPSSSARTPVLQGERSTGSATRSNAVLAAGIAGAVLLAGLGFAALRGARRRSRRTR